MIFTRLSLRAFCVVGSLLTGTQALLANEGHGEWSLAGDLSIWSFVTFVLFVWIVKKFAWSGFVSSLSDRERREQATISGAERVKNEAEAAFKQRKGQMETVGDQIREIMAEAHRDAEHSRQEIATLALNESKLIHNRATHDIAQARDQALHAIFEGMADKVVSTTQAQLAGKLTDPDHDRLIDDCLRGLTA